MSKINVKGTDITIITQNDAEYISLTEMVSWHEEGSKLIERWFNNKSTIDFLGVWEQMYNPNFKTPEFRGFRENVGSGSFFISAKKWIESTGAIGIYAKAGRGGGTYAHKDIAFEFGTYISPEFKLLLIKEFQNLKEKEAKGTDQIWDIRRFLTKSNYRVQTDAIKDVLIPNIDLSKKKEGHVYAEEADLLYLAMYGYTSKQWRENNPELSSKGMNLRDYADTYQLIVLNSLETFNAELIRNNIDADKRFSLLRNAAIQQLKSIKNSTRIEDSFIESPNVTKPTASLGEETDKAIGAALRKGKFKGGN